ncbi:uncharacterized protein LOC120420284 [Culex pipiens pallens]|uniref:uncharacterized protein LOC120420284 n=1 Tax=Culex pipiens pallens TaxID=42434 RepID=UPI0019535EF4|nr:uncharacterized protein LOC120420284 [Culex pipiens pallens]
METSFLYLLLLLVPAIVSAQVPTGCVEIKNANIKKYLVVSHKESHDADRRHVTYSRVPEQWLIYHDQGHYRVLHQRLLEDLFVSAQAWRGRYVFTWMPGERITNGLWDILPTGGGNFIFQNAYYRDCLHTKGSFGWVQALPECQGRDFEWEIRLADC